MASTAGLMGLGMGLQAAGQGIDKTFQYKMAELRQKSLEQLEAKRLDIAERQVAATEARAQADADYRKEAMNMQYQDRFYERGNKMVASVIGEAGMSDLERQVFLKLVENYGSIEDAKKEMEASGMLGEGTKVGWSKLDKLYKGLNRLHGQTIGRGTDTNLSIGDIQEFFPALGGYPTEDPLMVFDPIEVDAQKRNDMNPDTVPVPRMEGLFGEIPEDIPQGDFSSMRGKGAALGDALAMPFQAVGRGVQAVNEQIQPNPGPQIDPYGSGFVGPDRRGAVMGIGSIPGGQLQQDEEGNFAPLRPTRWE